MAGSVACGLFGAYIRVYTPGNRHARDLTGPRRKTRMKKSGSQSSKSPSRLIDARIKELGDWRGERLGRRRALIKEADPGGGEGGERRGVPGGGHDGIIFTG